MDETDTIPSSIVANPRDDSLAGPARCYLRGPTQRVSEEYEFTTIPVQPAPAHSSNSHLITNDKTGKKAPQYIAGLTASLAALSMGTTLGWTSQISQQLMDGALGFPITQDELGWAGSLMHLGAATLSLFTGIICELIGRKLSMLLLIIPVTFGWCLIIWAQSIVMLYFGRFITGMVAGSFCALSSIYISEISQKEIRGALGSYTQLMISNGILFANIVGKFLNVFDYTITCAAIPLIFGIIFVFMPETPIYLLKQEKTQDARSVLVRLRGPKYNVDKELKEIESFLKENQSDSGMKAIKECMKMKSTQKACIIALGLMIFKTTNGIDAITAYTSYIFSAVDIKIDPQIGTIMLSSFQVISVIFQSFIVDRSGRKVLLAISAFIMALCLTVVALSFLLKNRNIISEEYYIYVDYLPLIALIVFTVAFGFGMGPIPWLMLGEIFPQEIKSVGISVATFVSWFSSFVVAKLFLVINSSWGDDVAFFIFAICTFISVIFTVMFVPETKNKTFEEIQKEL